MDQMLDGGGREGREKEWEEEIKMYYIHVQLPTWYVNITYYTCTDKKFKK